MSRVAFVPSAILLAALCGFAAPAQARNDIVLVFNGFAVPNTQPVPTIPAFTSWCQGTCTPSVQQPVFDAASGAPRGSIAVWTTPFVASEDGKSFCFSEFIAFTLPLGTIYTASNLQGVCGGIIDNSVKPTSHAAKPAVVVGGGGDGFIVGGTGIYRRASGSYTDRVFVELSYAPDGVNYYDQLIFKISLDP